MSCLTSFRYRSYIFLISFLSVLSIHQYLMRFSGKGSSPWKSPLPSKHLQSRQKIILITKWRGSKNFYEWEDANNVCSNRCSFTTNESAWKESSAIVFHANNHEYLSQNITRPSPDQIWIWLNLEPAVAYQANMFHKPSVHLTSPYFEENNRLQFNWTITYRRDSDIFAPYSRIYAVEEIPKQIQIIKDFKQHQEGYTGLIELPSLNGFRERKMAAWIVSHCSTWSHRESLVAELNKTIPVDIYGSCGTTHQCTSSRKNLNRTDECRSEIHQHYKFYLAFENALCEDYVTEKFFECLKFEMIPVVYGSAEYSKLFPPKSFINVLDYNSIVELGDYLNYLSESPEEWLKYFEWRKHYWVLHSTYLPAYCDICDKLVSEEEQMSPRGMLRKQYKDIHNWWLFNDTTGDKSVCKNDKEVQQILTALGVKLE